MTAPRDSIRGRDLIRRGPYARLWWSQAISSLGDWVTLFATFALAARIAGGGRSASVAILVPLVARILPGLVFGILGGVVADRWDRKRTMVVADFGRAALVLVLLAVGNFRDLFLVTFAIEVLSLIRQPAREAVVPLLIPGRHLMAANGLNLIAAYGTAPVGSALYAVLARIGREVFAGVFANPAVAAAFAFDAVTFLVSGVVVLTIPIPRTEVRAERRARSRFDLRAPLRDIADGFRFVTRYPTARRLVTGMALGLFGGGALFVLGQPYSEQVLNASDEGYGLVLTALGLGVGGGMMVMTLWGRRITRREAFFGAGLVVTGVSIVFAGLSSHVGAAAGWVFIAGAGTGVAYVSGFTQLHAAVTDDIRGRTFAALFAAARLALLVSFGLAGVAAAAVHGVLPGVLSNGIRTVIVFAGLTIAAAGGITLWSVRDQLGGEPLDEEAYRTLQEAGDALTWMRGYRPPEEV